jgi:Sel1 repeat
MNQRFTLDRRSFEQFLAALSLLQQLKRQAAYQHPSSQANQPFLSLLQLQRAINAGTVDLPAVMASVIRLTRSVLGANAAGIWLFRSEDEFSCCAQIGNLHHPDRLGADILAQLAESNHPDANSCAFSPTLRKASHYPGSPNSIAIAALRMNENILGAVAAFSSDFQAFASRDLDNLRFLAGLFEQALQKAMQAGYREAIALEQAALVRLLVKIAPQASELARQFVPSKEARASGENENFSSSNQRGVYCRLPQATAFSTGPSKPAAISASTGQPSTADLSVPGVGVRAALGDVRSFSGDEESFFVSEMLRGATARLRALASQCRSATSQTGEATISRIRSLTSYVVHLPQSVAQPLSIKPLARFSSITMSITTSARNGFTRVRHWKLKVRLTGTGNLHLSQWLRFASTWSASKDFPGLARLRFTAAKSRTLMDDARDRLTYLLRLASVEARSLKRQFRQKRANLSAAVAQERMRARIAHRRQKSLLTNSAELTGEALQHAGESLAVVASSAGHSTLTTFSTLKRQVIALKRPRFNPLALRRSASAIGVLTIMAIFLASQAGLRHTLGRVNAALASPGAMVASAPAAQADASDTPEAGPTSHLEITDASVADTLHDLTRYEIITLQRAAEYGDDEAALQLGMAYETGYYLRQNCAKAAHWVKIAAEAGNPAAAYNLALRYQVGDGLEADASAAEHWLRVASSRQYSPAKLALATVR